jgi:hypothetical protein
VSLNAQTLLELSQLHLSAEQWNGVVRILAQSEQAVEERRKKASERQRRYRDRHRNVVSDVNGDVTSDATRAHDVEINNTLPEENKKNYPPLSPPGFDEFWEAYPTRDGSRDKKAAVKAFRAALKRDSLEAILAGARAYRNEMVARGKLNTEFVRQARTWLNADGWKETYGNGTNGTSEQETARRFLEEHNARVEASRRDQPSKL